MINAKNAAVLAILLFFAVGTFADVPPDPGYTRASAGIVLESQEDFADYRFFIVSGNQAREVFVKKGEKMAVAGFNGGGACYRSGRFLAIPKTSLAAFGEKPEGEKLQALLSAVAEEKVDSIIKLFDHSFTREIREADARKVHDAAYRIERGANGPVAIMLDPGYPQSSTNGVSFGIKDVSSSFTPFGLLLIAFGTLMSVAFVVLGLWAFIRFFKKIK